MESVWMALRWIEAGSLLLIVVLFVVALAQHVKTNVARERSLVTAEQVAIKKSYALIYISVAMVDSVTKVRLYGVLRYLAMVIRNGSGDPRNNADNIERIMSGELIVKVTPTYDDPFLVRLEAPSETS